MNTYSNSSNNIINEVKNMMQTVIKSYNTDFKNCRLCIAVHTVLPSWTHKDFRLTFIIYWNMQQFYWEVENEDMSINKLCGADILKNIKKMLDQNVISSITLEEC